MFMSCYKHPLLHCVLKSRWSFHFLFPRQCFSPDVDVIFHLAARGESVDKFCRGLLILICSCGRPHPFIPYLFFSSPPLPLFPLSLFISESCVAVASNSQLTTPGPRHLLMEFVSRPAWRIPATWRARGRCQRRIKDSSCPGPGRKPTNHISENLSNIPPPPLSPRPLPSPSSSVCRPFFFFCFSCYSSHSCVTSSLGTLRWNNSESPWGLSHTSIWWRAHWELCWDLNLASHWLNHHTQLDQSDLLEPLHSADCNEAVSMSARPAGSEEASHLLLWWERRLASSASLASSSDPLRRRGRVSLRSRRARYLADWSSHKRSRRNPEPSTH